MSIHARIFRDRCTLSLDTTGEHLHKRGYRTETFQAPLRETSAAALLQLAHAEEYDVIVDPFCGSGTIPIEADLLVRNCAPGISRRFAIESSPLHSTGRFAEAHRRAMHRCDDASLTRILGFDINPDSVKLARRCAQRACAKSASFDTGDALNTVYADLLRVGERGLVVTNVPYGHRLGTKASTTALLNDFVERLARTAQGWDFAIITPRIKLANDALVVQQRILFQNGGIPVQALIGNVPAQPSRTA